MAKVAVVYFSGYGHTAKQAEAVIKGAAGVAGVTVTDFRINENGDLPEGAWNVLVDQDAIIYGSPTYMGGPAWQFKKFADASSKAWFSRAWQDKVFGGFTNSASFNGDKQVTLIALQTLASQHGGVWVSLGMLPSNSKAATRSDVNNLGGERYFTPGADTYANLSALPGVGRTWKVTLKRLF